MKKTVSCKSCRWAYSTALIGFILSQVTVAVEIATWPGIFDIQAWETGKLTESDVVGPDGIVYPNWTGAGVEGGIPVLDANAPPAGYTVFKVTSPNAIASAVSSALANASALQKSIVYIPAGTYSCGEITIDRSNVVLIGAGKASTFIDGGFTFAGGDWTSGQTFAVATIKRGAVTATFESAAGYRVGMIVRIVPTDDTSPFNTMPARYNKPDIHVNYTDAINHFGRVFFARITAITGTTLTFDRSFPYDLYLDEKPQMRRGDVIEYCGLQDLTIQQSSTEPLVLRRIANSWIKGVKIIRPPNWPISSSSNSQIRMEIRDCDFLGTQADINNGSNGYLGWINYAVDCIMDNCTASDLRHMAIFQNSVRSVIRNCSFGGQTIQSPQLHGRFPLDNLVEGTTFNPANPRGKTGFASDPAHTLRHGPNGPRNVMYNNRILAGAANFTLGGATENPIFAYNRVLLTDMTEAYPPVMAFDRNFDVIFKGNHFQAMERVPALNLEDITCSNWFVQDNSFYGTNGSLWAGDGSVAVDDNNRFYPVGTPVGIPTPETESIYQWQKNNANTPRLVIVIKNKKIMGANGRSLIRIVRVKTPLDASQNVALSIQGGSLAIPGSITIPAGQSYADILAVGSLGSGEATVKITAGANGLVSDYEYMYVIGSGSTTNFGTGRVLTKTTGLPVNWRMIDIGTNMPAGTVTESAGKFTIQGTGVEAASYMSCPFTSSGRRFVYQTIIGDGSIAAKLMSVTGEKQVGLMIADDAAWRMDYLWLEPNGHVVSSGYKYDWHGGFAEFSPAGIKTVPLWMRVSRAGSLLKAETSADGTTWTQKASVDLYQDNLTPADYKSQATLDNRMNVGMFVNSGTDAIATAVFGNVTVSGALYDYSLEDDLPPVRSRPLPLPSRKARSSTTGNVTVMAFDVKGRIIFRKNFAASESSRLHKTAGMLHTSAGLVLLREEQKGTTVRLTKMVID